MTYIFGLLSSRHHLDSGITYLQKVLGTQSANLILYHPMNESSGSTAVDQSPESNDGTYTGVTLANALGPDGVNSCPLFDGANDFNNFNTAGWRADIDLGDTFSISVWCKMFNSGVWTDGTNRTAIWIEVNSSNRIFMVNTTANNQLQWIYNAGGTSKQMIKNAVSTTDWFSLGITVDKTADQMRAYFNGTQEGATQTGLGVWAGTTAHAIFGAFTTTPFFPFNGWLAHGAIWNVTLTPAEMQKVGTV